MISSAEAEAERLKKLAAKITAQSKKFSSTAARVRQHARDLLTARVDLLGWDEGRRVDTDMGAIYLTKREDFKVTDPKQMLEVFKGDNFPQWAVSDLKAPVEVKTEEMVAIVEEDDSTSDASPFNPNWTRGEMIKWFSARGETVPRTATKASLTARAEALLNPPAEEAVEEEAPEEVAEEESTTEGESEGDE